MDSVVASSLGGGWGFNGADNGATIVDVVFSGSCGMAASMVVVPASGGFSSWPRGFF